jgi:leader peptidase (prepilin peptidase)/N-methyltransferase
MRATQKKYVFPVAYVVAPALCAAAPRFPIGQLDLMVLLTVLGWITWRDLVDMHIPDSANLLLGLCGLTTTWALSPALLPQHAAAALVAGGGLFLISELYYRLRGRDGLGLGDVKLVTAGALWIGPDIAIALVVATGTALCLGLVRLMRDRGSWSRPLPLGPFIALGILTLRLAGS